MLVFWWSSLVNIIITIQFSQFNWWWWPKDVYLNVREKRRRRSETTENYMFTSLFNKKKLEYKKYQDEDNVSQSKCKKQLCSFFLIINKDKNYVKKDLKRESTWNEYKLAMEEMEIFDLTFFGYLLLRRKPVLV